MEAGKGEQSAEFSVCIICFESYGDLYQTNCCSKTLCKECHTSIPTPECPNCRLLNYSISKIELQNQSESAQEGEESPEPSQEKEKGEIDKHQEVIIEVGLKMKNFKGKRATMSSNGKFYCRGKLDKKCKCCNIVCGPKQGCNCNACTELDRKYRNLGPEYKVNKLGKPSKFDMEAGKYFCEYTTEHDSQLKVCNKDSGYQCADCIPL
ncbi:unnamed protein product [Moneuplotes crassus]|uniref:RING-type domain-containing protein n=1 Tax=Euplotes crassus TaxID=5936 RepID=A0AAD1XTT1_EUPCR|nr:unnamed protein product [Moneuplotes crassus]